MKSFDIDEYNYRECEVHNHGFYLGEQSKQAEVDELRFQRDVLSNKVDELQKQIDEALKLLNLAYPESWAYCVDEAINILKGENHE